MIKRVVVYTAAVLLLCGFAYVLQSGEIYKRPKGAEDDVLSHMQLLFSAIEEENWEKADRTLTDLQNAWGIVLPRIQYNADRDDIIRMDVQLARTRGAIMAKNKAAALTELSEAKFLWHAVGR